MEVISTHKLMNKPADPISVATARKLLGVSTKKMADLLKDGTVRHYPNLLDKRSKLVSRAEILALMAYKEAA